MITIYVFFRKNTKNYFLKGFRHFSIFLHYFFKLSRIYFFILVLNSFILFIVLLLPFAILLESSKVWNHYHDGDDNDSTTTSHSSTSSSTSNLPSNTFDWRIPSFLIDKLPFQTIQPNVLTLLDVAKPEVV